MTEFEVKDLSSYIEYISSIGQTLINRRNSNSRTLMFRGQSNCSYELIPSIARNYNGKNSPLLKSERNMIDMAKTQMPDIFKADYEPIELLALLQHYGIPTRLLDVTDNALVGLYFSCSSDSKSDGEVIVFLKDESWMRTRSLVNAIADTYRFVDCEYTYLESFYGSIANQPYFLEEKYMMEQAHTSIHDGAEWIKYFAVPPIFTFAQIHSLRQQMQAGQYIIFPNTVDEDDGELAFLRKIDPIPKNHESIIGRAVIRHTCKEQILHELELVGISKKTLFPDNIDVVCEYIKTSFL